jgi:5'/3'-nucleotidase
MTTQKPLLLLTNDDGIDAPGIQALRNALTNDYEIMVVAPLKEQSGAGCSLASLHRELKVEERTTKEGKIWGYAVDGTPADCVKFALSAVGSRPDFVLSGINRGMNAGNAVFYSGTVAATIEATMMGYPAMAVSLATLGEGHFDDAAAVTAKLVPWLLKQEIDPRTFWNMNLPNLPREKMGRVRFASQGTSYFIDEFKPDHREGNETYYRNVGFKLVGCSAGQESDDRVVEAGDISLSLLQTNLSITLPKAAKQSLEQVWNKLIK